MEVVVFTNGCFDILHAGHVDLLTRARALGTKLIVGINSDRSVRQIKGATRPFVSEKERSAVLRGLRAVDEVITFDESTPARLIEEIKPDVLVKGGDWKTEEIVGADFVTKRGGKVYSLPLLGDFSTSALVGKIVREAENKQSKQSENSSISAGSVEIAKKSLAAHQAVFDSLIENEIPAIVQTAEMIASALKAGKKVLLCGNGGSAADAQHIAAEFVGRFERERRGFPAFALTTDTSALTALGNDYGFEQVFARQVQSIAAPDDVLIGISTSGNSPNVLAAIMAARKIGCKTIGLTGAKGKKLAGLCDAAVLVPAERTAHIQEAHSAIGHLWCEIADGILMN